MAVRLEAFTPTSGALTLKHIELKEANEFVEKLHRHHKRIQGHRFSLAAYHQISLVDVVIVGRPVGGANQDRWLEVTRCCTDGTRNACSFLYSAAARAGKALGYERIQTYILDSENGASLKAAGWRYERMSHPAGWRNESQWSRPARDTPDHLMGRKQLWYKTL